MRNSGEEIERTPTLSREFKNEPGTASAIREKLEISQPNDIEEKLHQTIIGQAEAISELARLYIKVKSGIRSLDGRPIDNIFLAGPSGVGKTESILAFLKLFLGADEDPKTRIAKIDGGQFQAWHEVSKLTGAPPGYKGHVDTPGLFDPEIVEKTYKVPYTDARGKSASFWVVLVDEVEKADDALQKTLLSALDKGTMTLGNNKTVFFRDAIFFFTSNLGNRELERPRVGFMAQSENPNHVIEKAYWEKFPPEFRGRITKKIIYRHLSPEELERIFDLETQKIERQFLAQGIALNAKFDPTARSSLLKAGYNRSEGARALGRIMEKEVLDQLVLIDSAKLHGKNILVQSNKEDKLEFVVVGSFEAKLPTKTSGNKVPHEISNEVWLERMTRAVTEEGYMLGNATNSASILPYKTSKGWPPRFSIIDAAVKGGIFATKKHYEVIGEFGYSTEKNWCIWIFGDANIEQMSKMAEIMSKTVHTPVKLILQKSKPIPVSLP